GPERRSRLAGSFRPGEEEDECTTAESSTRTNSSRCHRWHGHSVRHSVCVCTGETPVPPTTPHPILRISTIRRLYQSCRHVAKRQRRFLHRMQRLSLLSPLCSAGF